MDPIDNTDILVLVHDVLALSDTLLQRLEVARTKPENLADPVKQDTYEAVKTVVGMQIRVIKGLVEENIRITEGLEDLLKQLPPQ